MIIETGFTTRHGCPVQMKPIAGINLSVVLGPGSGGGWGIYPRLTQMLQHLFAAVRAHP